MKTITESLAVEFFETQVQGTCMSHQEVINTFLEFCVEAGQPLKADIDMFALEDMLWEQAEEAEVFLCEGCGWWCPIEERNNSSDGEHVCDDCYGEDED